SGAALGVFIDLRLSSGQTQIVDLAFDKLRLFGVIENVIGSNFSDFLHGNSANNFMDGRGGNNFIIADGGDDTIWAGGGNNLIYADTESDCDEDHEDDCFYLPGNDTVIVNGTGSNQIFTEGGKDSVTINGAGGLGNNEVHTGRADDTVSITGNGKNQVFSDG